VAVESRVQEDLGADKGAEGTDAKAGGVGGGEPCETVGECGAVWRHGAGEKDGVEVLEEVVELRG